jgi:hypothetical protein
MVRLFDWLLLPLFEPLLDLLLLNDLEWLLESECEWDKLLLLLLLLDLEIDFDNDWEELLLFG